MLIRHTVNNPGIWLMHCHVSSFRFHQSLCCSYINILKIAWHASGGLALQFVEKPDDIGPLFDKSGAIPKFSETCLNWGAYYTIFNKNSEAIQEDSGI